MEMLKTKVLLLSNNDGPSKNVIMKLEKDTTDILRVGMLSINGNYKVGSFLTWKANHMYLLSNRGIQKGDWYLFVKNNTICKANYKKEDLDTIEGLRKIGAAIKIEATTDKTLGLPNIPLSFVNKYVEKQGTIVEVVIEVIEEPEYKSTTDRNVPTSGKIVPKTRRDGTVVIRPTKTQWDEKEVIDLIEKYHLDHGGLHGVGSTREWLYNNTD